MKNHGVQKQHPIQAYVNVTTACLCFYMAWKGFNREDFYGPIPSRMKQCKMGNDGIPALPIGGKEMKTLSSYFARFPIKMFNDHSLCPQNLAIVEDI